MHSCGVILLLVHRLNFKFQLYSSVNQNMKSLLRTLLHASGFMREREQNDKQINSKKMG